MILTCPACSARVRVPPGRLTDHAKCARCKAQIAPVDHTVAVGSSEEFDELVRTSKVPVLVDFWATWCPPCRAVAPELEKLAKASAGKLVVAKVDTDRNEELGRRFRIESIPTLARFDGGKETKRVAGAMQAPAIMKTFGLE
jgi:thioredoxin 2